jgi:two-component system OmpR family response regulator
VRLLVAEDDTETAAFLRQGLTQAGHVVTVVGTGPEALAAAMTGDFDCLILDRMLPGRDGLSVLRMLRAGGIATPALMLTAVSGIAERVDALESGADDYLVKPFAFAELHARINVITRRGPALETETTLRVRDLEFDLQRRVLRRGGRRIELQPRELLLLETLMRNPHRVMTRTMLLERVWDFDFDPRTNIVETHISRLRSKLNAGEEIDAIVTVRGAGYMIRSD